MDFWISEWISGFHSGFLDFWISQWISGFQFGFLPTVYEISFVTDPSAGCILPQQFYTLYVGLCWCLSRPFVAVTERKIGVRIQRRTVLLINANFWPCVQRPNLYCVSITSSSVPFRSGFSVPFRSDPIHSRENGDPGSTFSR